MDMNRIEQAIENWEKINKEAEMAEKKNTKKREDVDLYDPKFVHFDWDGSLIDKKGFYNDDMGVLRKEIRNEGTRMMGTVIDCCDDAAPFVVQQPSNGHPSSWKFFYYDPNYEIKWAFYKEGKKLQYRQVGDEEWEDMIYVYEYYQAKELGPVYFDTNCRFEYRIKPEEQKPKVEVNVDVKVNNTSSDGKITITINGKECIFENAEQARMVLKEG